MAATVTLYTSAFCGYCHRAKALLAQKGVDYSELSVDAQPQLERRATEKSGVHGQLPRRALERK